MVICIISNTIIFVGTETEGSSKERNFANIKKGRSRYICYSINFVSYQFRKMLSNTVLIDMHYQWLIILGF